MPYGHAERNLAAIRLLEAETRQLLSGPVQLDPGHAQWLRNAADSASRRLRSARADRPAVSEQAVRQPRDREYADGRADP